MVEPPEPTRLSEPIWLEPYPDALLEDLADSAPGLSDSAPGPQARYETRETVGLAFVTALQHLPPRQRAVLTLRDALGFSGAEVASMLDTTEAAVKAALQRARATLADHVPTDELEAPTPGSRRERELVGHFTAAVERGDVDALVSLLTDDAWVRMPPQPYEYQGHAAVAAFLRDRAIRRGAPLRLVPTRANGQPAFGCYFPDAQAAIARAYGLMVLTLEGDRISAITWFGDLGLFPHFGLPRMLSG
jgi:RNA polymerase sigma-70 factor (ECF subfamily)